MNKNKKTFFVTTPIYYPSGKLHIGHVYTTTIASTLANYKKLMGYDVKFLTGSDEHGQKIEKKALENNQKPQEYVDKISLTFKKLWKKLNINYDYFSRTTNPSHKKSVSKQFSYLLESNNIYKGKYKGLYSIEDEEFFTKTQAFKKNNKYYHPLSNHELKKVEEESYFFKISKYQEWWKNYLKKNPRFILPNKIINELVNNFINKGLEDLSVTRSTFKWGIQIKEDKKHIMYVWLDALNNYITALGYNANNDLDFQKYWVNGDEIVHVVGKEITRFHGIYWPIILKANNLRLPTTIFSHGWIITSKGKMSKSKGNVIDPLKLLEKFDEEAIKYFFVAKIKTSQDGIFDEKLLKKTYNSELVNIFGNLHSRVTSLILQNFNKPLKNKKPTLKIDKDIVKNIIEKTKKFKNELDNFNIFEGFENLINLGRNLNQYIELTVPWKLGDQKNRLEEILNNLLNGIYAIFTMLSIVIPNKSLIAINSIGFKEINFDKIFDFNKFDDKLFKKIKPLFKK